nr:hypothetical protein [Mesomycoplasma ovipneumoniae]
MRYNFHEFYNNLITNDRAKKIKPNINIAHFVNFLIPRSFDTWNKSKSLDPISAPENEFECGDIISETKTIRKPKIAIKITKTVFNMTNNQK